MPFNISVDDNNSTLIHYQGVWTALSGSTRQWEGGVHATDQAGASATFTFRGYQVSVWGTIPGGTGINSIHVSVDGGTPSTINRTSNGSVVYNELYFVSPLLRDASHTIVVTNQGSDVNGNSEFMLDRFLFETGDEVPVFPTTTGTSTSTSTSANSSSSSQPFTSQGSSSHTKWGVIIGVIVACLGFLIAVLLFLLWKKTIKNKQRGSDTGDPPNPLTPTPFPLSPPPPACVADSDSASPLSPPGHYGQRLPQTLMSEKDGYQHYQQDTATSPTTLNLFQTTGVFVSSSTFESHPAIASDRSAAIPRQNSEGNHALDSTSFLEVSRRLSSLDKDKYDQPPPSYWRDS